jgi:hypothetical protein
MKSEFEIGRYRRPGYERHSIVLMPGNWRRVKAGKPPTIEAGATVAKGSAGTTGGSVADGPIPRPLPKR